MRLSKAHGVNVEAINALTGNGEPTVMIDENVKPFSASRTARLSDFTVGAHSKLATNRCRWS